MKNLLALVLILSATLVGCNEQTVIVPPFVAPQSDRVILMEEFTGASCPNCPAGAEQTADLLSVYPDNLVAVAIHSNFLAWPAKPGDLDLRIPAAQDIEDFLGQWQAKPEAAFNRVLFKDRGEDHIRVRTAPENWGNFVEDQLETFARVYIDIENDYDPDTRELNTVVRATAREDLQGEFRINVMVIENDIITKQKDATEIIEKFKQKHVLRALLTDVAGDSFFATLRSDAVKEYSTSFTIPDEENMGWWIPENMSVIAFVSDGSTKEVLQAAETPVIDQ